MLQLATLIQENSLEAQEKRLIHSFRVFAEQKNLFEIEIGNHITWILRFLRFHNKQHPTDLSQSDIELFVSSLAIEHNYDHHVQSNAIKALVFLYQDFLQIKISNIRYVKTKSRRGFVDHYGESDCRSILRYLKGTSLLMADLVVSGKLKLNEVVNLKLADIDIKKNRIKVRSKNGNTKFTLNIPVRLILDLRIQIMRVRQLMQIQTRQFSKTYQKGVSKLSSKSRQPSSNKQDEYLFPTSNTDNPQISSKSMQLTLLKNDLRIAIKRHLKVADNFTNKSSDLAKPIQLKHHFVSKNAHTCDPVVYAPHILNKAHQMFIPVNSPKNDRQVAFNFDITPKQSMKLSVT